MCSHSSAVTLRAIDIGGFNESRKTPAYFQLRLKVILCRMFKTNTSKIFKLVRIVLILYKISEQNISQIYKLVRTAH